MQKLWWSYFTVHVWKYEGYMDRKFIVCFWFAKLLWSFAFFKMSVVFRLYLVSYRSASHYRRWGNFLWAGCIWQNTSWCLIDTIIHSLDLRRSSSCRKDTKRASWFVEVSWLIFSMLDLWSSILLRLWHHQPRIILWNLCCESENETLILLP